jgi:hypothetical protein
MRTSGRNFIFCGVVPLNVDYQNNPTLPAIFERSVRSNGIAFDFDIGMRGMG